MDRKVSIVVTCYNHEHYIEECLRSIFSQSYQNIELLVFNDGSTDRSGEIIERLLLESPFTQEQTHYFFEENRGVSAVRNDALEKLSGEFLLFVDSDNFLNPNHVELLLNKLIEQEADIAYCQLWDFERQNNVLREDLDFELGKMLEGNLIDASSLVRVSSIGEARFDLGLTNQKLEDYDFWMNMIINEKAKPYFVKETKLNYRVLNASRSDRSNWDNYYNIYFYILSKYLSKIPQKILEAAKANVLIFVKGYEDGVKLLQEKERRIENQKTIIQEKDEEIKKILLEVDSLQENIKMIEKSATFRVGKLVTLPARKIRGKLRK